MHKYKYAYTNIDSVCEYIWLDGSGSIRSKTRVIKKLDTTHVLKWNYDASSTEQLPSDGDTEGILKPVLALNDPLRLIDGHNCLLVLCETYNNEGKPLKGNYRTEANNIFNLMLEEVPWFGLEQEYFIEFKKKQTHTLSNLEHYCGTANNYVERQIAEEHLNACLKAGLKISGLNAEVCPNQWEFQIGPCEGISAADHLIVARYLLEKICEKHDAYVDYSPKPNPEINGSGCHINFSTDSTRQENGIEKIYEYIGKLEKDHENTLTHYGKDNHLRLTGLHETSSMDKFTYGVGTRNTSIRIPNQVVKDGCGHFEDRRPAANIDPYDATSALFKAIFNGK